MSSVFDNLKGRVAEGLSGVVDAGKTSLRISGLRSQVRKLGRERQDKFTTLGHRVYAMVQADRVDQRELASLCQPIANLDGQLADLQRQLAEIESSINTSEPVFAHCTCGDALTPDSRFCRGCGKNVETIVKVALGAKETEPMRCVCGAALGRDSAFCSKCGKQVSATNSGDPAVEIGASIRSEQMGSAALEREGLSAKATASPAVPADTRACPSCGQTIPVSAKFCRHCGESTCDH